jgi:hypothetical protein
MSAETREKISFSLIEYHAENSVAKKIETSKKCKYCNKEFVPDKASRSYCSFECYNKGRKGNTKNEISYRTFLKILRRAFPNWKCPFCEWSYSFDVHHIRGRKDNNFNSLIMLCPNHHSLAHLGKLSVEVMANNSIGSKISRDDLLKFYNGRNEYFNINFHKYKMKKETASEMRVDRKKININACDIILGEGI